MKKYLRRLLFILLCTLPLAGMPFAYPLLAGDTFRFNYEEGQKFHIEGFTDEEIYRNDVLLKTVQIKNVGDLTVTEVSSDGAMHTGEFLYYRGDRNGEYMLEETYPTRFFRDVYGNYEISPSYFMPVVRGVPTFPKNPLDAGDQWTSKAHEAHDFRAVFRIDDPVILPAHASYQYLGKREIDGDTVAELSINYVINYTLPYSGEADFSQSFPYRVVGYFNQRYYWNLDRGVPRSYKENFDYIFIMSDGEVLEYRGSSHAVLTTSGPLDERAKAALAIEKRLKETLPSVSVTSVPEGISINVGEILFRFDSDELAEGAAEDLDNIVGVLRDFSKRRIRVIGHTDSTGPASYNQSLSLKRARKTAQELRRRLAALGPAPGITYIGMGEGSPIASNETEDGRRLNRRVEIIILDE
ncbi:MAG: OmpA family protein [Spirochaetes bacterium]|nr:OmpA family protein [Spirochaetota bacterium]